MILDSKDLMIDDWVHSKHHNVNTQITSIESNAVWLRDNSCWERHFMPEVEPIPITAEILKKNGFYHERNVGYVYEDSENYEVIFDSFNQELRILYNRDVVLNLQEWEFPVHRLQHALRLCGIDKEIVL